jgi:hydroxylamine dehydrogenase
MAPGENAMLVRSQALSKVIVLAAIALAFAANHASGQDSPSAKCIECHTKITPSIVSDWKLSKHSGADVGCVVCHGGGHTSADDVANVKIPTPETCAACHAQQVAEYRKGKHSVAWAAMKAMPTG